MTTDWTTLDQSFLQPFDLLEFNISETFWFFILIPDDFDRLSLIKISQYNGWKTEWHWHTLIPVKNCSSSISVRSNAKLPTNAVYGGWVGSGISSRGGAFWRSAMKIINNEEVLEKEDLRLELEKSSLLPYRSPEFSSSILGAAVYLLEWSPKDIGDEIRTRIGKRLHFVCPWPQCCYWS